VTRTSGWPRTCLAVLVLVAAVLVSGSGLADAASLPVSQCAARSGTIVAVDFGHWGGPLLRACGSTPTSGYALLNQGGWRTTGTGHDGPGFVCRIGYAGYHHGTQYPTPAEQACVVTPPAGAYWAFWHAGPGQDAWSYSQVGAMSYHPSPGSVELWLFGGTNLGGTHGSAVPGISPDRLRDLAALAASATRLPLVNAPPVRSARAAAGGGSPWPTAITAAVALMLGAAAVAANRRRARQRP
jgi:hypothetical protein